jgi:structural maintenance of chromosome 2
MAFVFVDTLICDDAESARLVTFSSGVGVQSVTLDDASGALSDGSALSSNGTLASCSRQSGGSTRPGKKQLEELEHAEREVREVEGSSKGVKDQGA